MLKRMQEERFEQLISKLKAIERTVPDSYLLADSPDAHLTSKSKLPHLDQEALMMEMNRLQKQLDSLKGEVSQLHHRQETRSTFDLFSREKEQEALQNKITTAIWIAQSRGINTCWQIADRLNRAYDGIGYVTMQPHLTERDRRANEKVIARVTRASDRILIETAFMLAEVLNGIGGPSRGWDQEWITNERRIEIIEESFRLLRQVIARNLQPDFEVQSIKTKKTMPLTTKLATI